MKTHLVVALVGLAIGLTMPALAEQTVDPKTAEQIRALAQKYDDAINRHDQVAVAALYTQDGVRTTNEYNHGTLHGRQAIEKAYANWDFKQWQLSNYFTRVDRVVAVGNEVRSSGTWSCVFKSWNGTAISEEGYYTWVIAREGDAWKLRRTTKTVSGSGAGNSAFLGATF
jgi:uncharacterized protein (TIGR02246 family)